MRKSDCFKEIETYTTRSAEKIDIKDNGSPEDIADSNKRGEMLGVKCQFKVNLADNKHIKTDRD